MSVWTGETLKASDPVLSANIPHSLDVGIKLTDTWWLLTDPIED